MENMLINTFDLILDSNINVNLKWKETRKFRILCSMWL